MNGTPVFEETVPPYSRHEFLGGNDHWVSYMDLRTRRKQRPPLLCTPASKPSLYMVNTEGCWLTAHGLLLSLPPTSHFCSAPLDLMGPAWQGLHAERHQQQIPEGQTESEKRCAMRSIFLHTPHFKQQKNSDSFKSLEGKMGEQNISNSQRTILRGSG